MKCTFECKSQFISFLRWAFYFMFMVFDSQSSTYLYCTDKDIRTQKY